MTRYSRMAIGLHWLIAALLIYNYGLGERTEHLRQGQALFASLQLHKSIGVTVLLLSLWRLAIKLWRPQPFALNDSKPAKFLSSTVHALFYVVMIAAPLTGWIIVSTAKIEIPTLLFGVVPWPHLPVERAWHEIAEETHALLSKLMLGLIALHLIGAIRHQFFMKDGLFDRMMPTPRAGFGALLLALTLLGGAFALGRAGPIPGMQQAAAPAARSSATSVGERNNTPQTEAKKTEEATVEVADKEEASASEKISVGPVSAWQPAAGGQLGFTVTVNGEQVAGRFNRWSSKIIFDPERLDKSSIRTSIDLASVSTGDGERDAMLSGGDFFATTMHPQAVFVATNIRSIGGNRYRANGTLTLRGVSRPVRLDFTLDIKGDRATANGTAMLSRGAFGVGSGQFEGGDTIGTSVTANFRFNAARQ